MDGVPFNVVPQLSVIVMNKQVQQKYRNPSLVVLEYIEEEVGSIKKPQDRPWVLYENTGSGIRGVPCFCCAEVTEQEIIESGVDLSDPKSVTSTYNGVEYVPMDDVGDLFSVEDHQIDDRIKIRAGQCGRCEKIHWTLIG